MCDKLIVPAYFHPAVAPHLWTRLADAASRLGERLIVIADPCNGPGVQVEQAYTDAIRRITGNGGQVIGYVYTSYARQQNPPFDPLCPSHAGDPHVEVDADIEKWYTFYPAIGGIFLDEVSSGQGDVGFYQTRYEYIQRIHRNTHPGTTGLVVFNPGTTIDPQYFSIENALFAVYEGSAADFRAWQPATAHVRFNQRCAILIYAASPSDFLGMLQQVQGLGGLYVTDGTYPGNPWESLPPYFEDLVKVVEQSRMSTAGLPQS